MWPGVVCDGASERDRPLKSLPRRSLGRHLVHLKSVSPRPGAPLGSCLKGYSYGPSTVNTRLPKKIF